MSAHFALEGGVYGEERGVADFEIQDFALAAGVGCGFLILGLVGWGLFRGAKGGWRLGGWFMWDDGFVGDRFDLVELGVVAAIGV